MIPLRHSTTLLFTCFVFLLRLLQPSNSQTVGTFPHIYPNKPAGEEFSPEWQEYFKVTHPLPNVTFPLGRSFAGNIPVGRPNQPNDTLFFWAFEREEGSLTRSSSDNKKEMEEPWGVWLQGGPGSSSLLGLLFENGPLHVSENYSLFANKFGWNTLADYVWVDQPVGVGFGTVEAGGFAPDEDQVGIDFFGFLANLVKVFPSLKTRPLYITGESYAGTYIPYIAKTYFGLTNPPVNLAKIAIGDGSLGNDVAVEILPTLTVIETFPQLIGYDPDVYEYFKTQHHLCGFDLNLTYPQTGGKFPTLSLAVQPASSAFLQSSSHTRNLKSDIIKHSLKAGLFPRLEELRRKERRDGGDTLEGRPNNNESRIDPWYGCDLYDEMIDYALNFSLPWKGHNSNGFDVYNIPDALFPEAPMDASIFLNDNRTRTAIHAPTSKNWTRSINYGFSGPRGRDPSDKPSSFLDELATNATERDVGVVIYSGNFDSLVSHMGSQVIIQNTTFGGIQGFTRPPATPWFDDHGEFAGIVHQERNWTYVLVQGAGHRVPQQRPEQSYILLREFILGSNQTGLVVVSNSTSGSPHWGTVIGGENLTLADPVLAAHHPGIYVGSGTTESTFVYPVATIDAWDRFFKTARGSLGVSPVFAQTKTQTAVGGASSVGGVSASIRTGAGLGRSDVSGAVGGQGGRMGWGIVVPVQAVVVGVMLSGVGWWY
ncbi:Alpha/Beta hydrolase protein [Irpex rosettiformis]|uniref:Alpha/Beta hydrolase protein n=1 Tax=Irpex rosettiformis TaxID=378272 RepID=A0ACB8TMF0_9APHY|nr:Alpha/Beta hydrolase protein [Irpex rosettiformis]